MNIVYIPEVLLFVCNTNFELQYKFRIKTDRTTVPTRIFFDLMVTNCQVEAEWKTNLHLLQIKLRVVFALQILSAGSFDLTEIISRDPIVEITKQTMVRNFLKFRKRKDYCKRSWTWSVLRVVSLCFCYVLLLIHFIDVAMSILCKEKCCTPKINRRY